jgi:hypothetical protein
MAGYMQDEFELMQQLLRDMEADMIKVGHGQQWQAPLNTSLSYASGSVTPVHGDAAHSLHKGNAPRDSRGGTAIAICRL